MDQITSTVTQSAPPHYPAARKYYCLSYDRLRLILMFFMCIKLTDTASEIGAYAQTFSGFSAVAFYILSGFLILRESPHRSERILRTVKRSALVFAALGVFYFVVNYFYYRHVGASMASDLAGKRVWFNFLVLNLWPLKIGSAIWYVQAYLYAYVIIYFLEKWELLRLDWLIAVLLIAFTVVTGELCGVVQWNILGYSCLPGCFFTRALPYILLGGFIRRKEHVFFVVPRFCYAFGVVVGFALMLIETAALAGMDAVGYYGHLIGMTVTAFSLCLIAFQNADFEKLFGSYSPDGLSRRWYINCIYYLFQPVSLLLTLLLGSFTGMGIAAFAVCFGIGLLLSLIGKLVSGKQQ